MSEEGWPADPTDPRCPECGEPVSATASYCMHCEADLPSADATSSDPTAAESDASTTAASGTVEAATESTSTTEDGRTGLLHPEGLLDDTATLVVAVVAGLLSGVLVTILLAFPLPGGAPFLAGAIGWLAVTVHVARSPTAFEAVRRGSYLFAGLLAVLPFVLALAAPMQENTLGQRLTGMLVFGFFAWPTAAVVAGLGFSVDRLADHL